MKTVTISLFIDEHHPKKNGMCAVTIRVTFLRAKRYYPTGISLTIKEYEKVMGAKRRTDEQKETYSKVIYFLNKANEVNKKLEIFTFEKFEKKYFGDTITKDTLNLAFADYTKELRKAGRIGTAVSYECAQSSLNKFFKGAKFTDITPDALTKYEKWMLNKGNSITTIGIYLRSLRTLFNNVIAEDILPKEYYPFGKRKYEIPTGSNVKKSLSLNDIALIYYHKANNTEEKSKDYWLFMYLCNGINVKDMCLLKYGNIKGEILEFERAKTVRTKRNVEPIRVSLNIDAKKIIKKWGNKEIEKDNYIFPVLTKGLTPERERQLIQQCTQVINCHMKSIAQQLNITNEVTTYAARHSFATILQRSGASTEFISEALGHSNVKTTQNYLAGFEDETKKETTKALTAFKKPISPQKKKLDL